MCVLELNDVFPCTIEERINRFVVKVKRDEKFYLAHNTNTGRLQELLTKGKKAFCKPLKNPSKTSFRLFAVELDEGYAVIDTMLQETVFEKAVKKNMIDFLKMCNVIGRNPKIGKSTFDFILNCNGEKVIVETKSAVLKSEDGFGMYPDCPTKRGRRHIKELINLSNKGFRTLLLFIVAFSKAKGFKPYKEGDPDLYKSLKGFIPSNMMIKAIGIEFSPKESCVELYSSDLEIRL